MSSCKAHLLVYAIKRIALKTGFFRNCSLNVVQKLECSLLALKPGGFVSPVKAY